MVCTFLIKVGFFYPQAYLVVLTQVHYFYQLKVYLAQVFLVGAGAVVRSRAGARVWYPQVVWNFQLQKVSGLRKLFYEVMLHNAPLLWTYLLKEKSKKDLVCEMNLVSPFL